MVVTKVIRDQVVNYGQDAAVDLTSSASNPVAVFHSLKGKLSPGILWTFPSLDRAKLCPQNPNDGFDSPRELGHGLEPKPSWDEVFVAKASPNVPMEEETWVGDVPGAKAQVYPTYRC